MEKTKTNLNSNHNHNLNSNNSSSNSNNYSSSNHRSLQKQSSSHLSMSDTESQVSQVDSFHSPLRFDSPLRSDEPDHNNNNRSSSKAIVSLDKYYSPRKHSSENLSFPATPATPATPPAETGGRVYFSRAMREEVAPGVTKVGPARGGGADVEGGDRQPRRPVEAGIDKVALGFRVCEVVLCLISFSVMAADKTQGWSGDSFDRYKEYRYCVAVNVIGFVYSAFQAFDLAYSLASRKHFLSHNVRYHFTFSMDQILAYLIMSASSSAATRADDWISNWGKDEFTEMATASVAMSFLAFGAFALSSLVSGYALCNRNSL